METFNYLYFFNNYNILFLLVFIFFIIGLISSIRHLYKKRDSSYVILFITISLALFGYFYQSNKNLEKEEYLIKQEIYNQTFETFTLIFEYINIKQYLSENKNFTEEQKKYINEKSFNIILNYFEKRMVIASDVYLNSNFTTIKAYNDFNNYLLLLLKNEMKQNNFNITKNCYWDSLVDKYIKFINELRLEIGKNKLNERELSILHNSKNNFKNCKIIILNN